MTTPVVAIIPARLGSTRFPGKVLASKTGKPLIQHVWEAARNVWTITRLAIACDDPKVAAAVRAFGGEAVMTSPDHPNGSSRLAEAARLMQVPGHALIVNIQGDEPEIDPVVVDSVVALAKESGAEVTTLATPFHEDEDPADPNMVKVVLRRDQTAMYFSRALLPFTRSGSDSRPDLLRHIGLYVYRADFLQTYVSLPPSPCERCEMLEQLRVLENGFRIAVAVHDCRGQGIDTPEQYEAFVVRTRDHAAPYKAAKSRQKVG
jgi:3-deoxy-manno-octulosonate cytidylyltransferase (CMP-KDO synthetase)